MTQLRVLATLAMGQYGRMAVSLLSAPILARSLGPSGRGLFAVYASLDVLAVLLLGAGMTQSFGYHYRLADSPESKIRAAAEANGAISLARKRSLAVLPFSSIAAYLIDGGFAAAVVGFIVLLAPFAVSYGMHRQIAVLEKRDRDFSWIDGAPAAVFGLSVVVLSLLKVLTLETAVAAMLLSRGLRGIYGRRVWPKAPTGALSKGFKKYGVQAMPSTLAQLAQGSVAQFALLPAGTETVGQFAIGQVWANLLNPLFLALGLKTFRDRGRPPPIWKAILYFLPPTLLLGGGAIWAVPVIFGQEFVDAAAVAACLSCGSAGLGIFLVYRSILERSGNPKLVSQVQVAYLLFVAVLVPVGVAILEKLVWVAALVAGLMLLRGLAVGWLATRLFPKENSAPD